MDKNTRDELVENMIKADNKSDFLAAVKKYIFFRLELPEGPRETNIYLLVLYSVRIKMPNEDVKTLESRLATVDCHQTSYIVSKKTLLMMEIEREIDVHISPEESEKAETIPLYADALWRRKNDGK